MEVVRRVLFQADELDPFLQAGEVADLYQLISRMP